MPTCSRNGCKKEFDDGSNVDGACKFHPGGPVFHEGLKSWSCCKEINKPELEFDQFMKIEGCETGKHSIEAAKAAPKARSSEPASATSTAASGAVTATPVAEASSKEPVKEVFGAPSNSISAAKPKAASPAPVPVIEEEDDLSVPVQPGATCIRKGCNAAFESEEESRKGEGEAATCTYHPAPPIFHEGSKGYMCCKRRVLEFDEFLEIKGCKVGRHCFVAKKNSGEEVITTCRIDHYQTPQTVCVSVFAKKADKELSTVSFDEAQVHLDLFLPDSKRFRRSISLYGPILPSESTFAILGTKVELNLKKKVNMSWNVLEATDRDISNFQLTFGVGGRTGTIGGRQAVLDSSNKAAGPQT